MSPPPSIIILDSTVEAGQLWNPGFTQQREYQFQIHQSFPDNVHHL